MESKSENPDVYYPHASQVLRVAQDEALRAGYDFIGSDHLLLGIMQQSDYVSPMIFRIRNVTVDAIRAEAKSVYGYSSAEDTSAVQLDHKRELFSMKIGDDSFVCSSYVVNIIKMARRQITDGSKVQGYHLLLAMVDDEFLERKRGSVSEGVATKLLENLGVDLNKLRECLIEVVDKANATEG